VVPTPATVLRAESAAGPGLGKTAGDGRRVVESASTGQTVQTLETSPPTRAESMKQVDLSADAQRAGSHKIDPAVDRTTRGLASRSRSRSTSLARSPLPAREPPGGFDHRRNTTATNWLSINRSPSRDGF